jgi:hypothetical protein
MQDTEKLAGDSPPQSPVPVDVVIDTSHVSPDLEATGLPNTLAKRHLVTSLQALLISTVGSQF